MLIKRTLFVSTLMIAILTIPGMNSFGQTSPKQKSVQAKKTTVKPVSAVADIAQGKALIAKSDCLACHKLDTKIVGPAYLDVAKKYPSTEANYTMLANKIIKGGTGVWGQIPMSPHPTISVSDAKKMAKYILSLKAK